MCYCCVCFSKQIKLFKKIKKVSSNEDYSSRRNLVELRYGLMPLWHIMSAMIKIWNMIQDVSTLLSCVSSLSSEHACQHNHAILVGEIILKLPPPMGGTIYSFVWRHGTLTHVQVTLLLHMHVESLSYENTNCHFWVSWLLQIVMITELAPVAAIHRPDAVW